MTYTYDKVGGSLWERVGRGWWLSYNPPEDELLTHRKPRLLTKYSYNVRHIP